MKEMFIYIVCFVLPVIISCDVENLLKTAEEPVVSDIYSDATDYVVQPMQLAKFWVNASNPEEGTLTYLWTASGGEYLGSRQNDTLVWRAPVTGGRYNVSVKVSNSEKDVTRSREITVPSLNAPQVEIVSPENNAFLVQQSTVIVSATAVSENGIFQTDFYVNDSLVASRAGNSGNSYQFDWLIREQAGVAELKIAATAKQTGLIGCDSISVNIEGIIPGKLHAGK
jgi:hypothetical protein